ncbi:MAG: alpha/beta fold hydrolase [Candidatus Jordarchaeales archaeon]
MWRVSGLRRVESDFVSGGLKCAGWLYLPEVKKPPVVVMAHGFAAERSFQLTAFAERFCREGMAVFLFDYRHFGDSEGRPRNLVSVKKQLEDWRNALKHVRSLEEVDGERIALWGTSFSGGHVLVTAAQDQNVSAVVAQVPFVDGLATASLLGLRFIIKAAFHGTADTLASLFGRVHHVPVVADPDRFAVMNTPGSKDGYLSLIPEGSSWKNECPARILLSIPFYRPVRYAPRIKCPVLIVYAEKDTLIPPRAVRKTASKIRNVKVIGFDVGHFDVYFDPVFSETTKIEAEFLKENLQEKRS